MSLFEDDPQDILAKARYGLGLSVAQAAAAAGLTAAEVERFESGGPFAESSLRALAAALELSPDKLAAFARQPEPPGAPSPAVPFAALSLGEGFRMNAYLLADPATREGFVVDPGFQAPRILESIESLRLKPAAILLTHGHHDHVEALEAVHDAHRVPVLALEAERPLLGAFGDLISYVPDGHVATAGSLRIRFAHTPGHTDGMATLVEDARGLAFVGDSLFARSLGRASRPGERYATLRRGVRDRILALPPATLLAPGHGPLTNVEAERRLNAFFP